MNEQKRVWKRIDDYFTIRKLVVIIGILMIIVIILFIVYVSGIETLFPRIVT